MLLARHAGTDPDECFLDRMTEGAEIGEFFDTDGHVATVKGWLSRRIEWIVGGRRRTDIAYTLGSSSDIVIANNFLCHMNVPMAIAALRNISRLVRPHGYLFCFRGRCGSADNGFPTNWDGSRWKTCLRTTDPPPARPGERPGPPLGGPRLDQGRAVWGGGGGGAFHRTRTGGETGMERNRAERSRTGPAVRSNAAVTRSRVSLEAGRASPAR